MATQTVNALSVLMSAGTPVSTVTSSTTITHSSATPTSSTMSSVVSSASPSSVPPPSHSVPTPTATPTHITTHVEAAAPFRSNGLTGAEITGIGIGITFATINLLIILIFLIRWHQRKHPQPMAASDYSPEKPDEKIGDETWVYQPKKSLRPSMVSPGTVNPNPATNPVAFPKPEASLSSEDTPSSFSSESTYSQNGVAPLRSGAPPQRPQGPYVQPPAVARNESLRSPFDNRPRGSLRNPSRAGSNLR